MSDQTPKGYEQELRQGLGHEGTVRGSSSANRPGSPIGDFATHIESYKLPMSEIDKFGTQKFYSLKEGILNALGKQIPYEKLLTLEGRKLLKMPIGTEWLMSKPGSKFLKTHGIEFLSTKQGNEWFQEYGNEWFESDYGLGWLNHGPENQKNHTRFFSTELGRQYFRESSNNQEWLKSRTGQLALIDLGLEFIRTEQGKKWFESDGEWWLKEGAYSSDFMGDHGIEFINRVSRKLGILLI